MKLIKVLLILLLINSISYAQKSSTVTFNVYMNNLFHPDYDTLFVAGSFNEWAVPGSDLDLMLTDPDEDWIYSVQMELPIGDYEYKYFFGTGWNCGEWNGGGNRIFEVAEDGQNIVLYDSFGILPGQMPFTITFHITSGDSPVNNVSVILGRYSEQLTDESGYTNFSSDGEKGCHVPYFINKNGYDSLEGILYKLYSDETFEFELIAPVNILTNKNIQIETNNNQLTIKSEQQYNLNIYNILGKQVYQDNIPQGTSDINTEKFQSGIYILKFENKDERYIRKIIIN